MMLLTMLKRLWNGKKKALPKETAKTPEKELQGPFHDISEFAVGMVVSTKPGVSPGGRREYPVEEVGEMQLFGEMCQAVRVKGLPYLAEELIIHYDDCGLARISRPVEKPNHMAEPKIRGLWQ